MQKQEYRFAFDVYENSEELSEQDAWLVNKARATTAAAYAPYSAFKVGAVARLVNGEIVIGTNQENAAYPVGICAERVLLSAASSIFPNMPIDTIAISYNNTKGESSHPISPCGICRQTLLEYEERLKRPIRLILTGMEGKVFVVERSVDLLPLSFGSIDLK